MSNLHSLSRRGFDSPMPVLLCDPPPTLQDLPHPVHDSERRAAVWVAGMDIRHAAPRPVALMRVAGLAPVVACLARTGAPVMRLLQCVHLPPDRKSVV